MTTDGKMTGEFWRIARVKQETGLCTSAIYAMMRDGVFPKNFAVTAQARAWLSSEVEAWKFSRLATRSEKVAERDTESAA